jgi:hypothetical protein
MKLTDERAAALFAWVSRAFAGEPEYNDLYLAIVAIFGNLPKQSEPVKMAQEALKQLPQDEEKTVGASISLEDREMSSLGAMGASQWTGRFRTRPHSLLTLSNFTCVDDWVKTLPRGVKRTLKKANAQNFTVISKQIRGGQPAPHSSLAHFKCVLEHEVRLLAGLHPSGFFDALGAAVGRYVETTRMTGEIQEYRLHGRVIAFAHEVRLITLSSLYLTIIHWLLLQLTRIYPDYYRCIRERRFEVNGSMPLMKQLNDMYGFIPYKN